MLQVDQYAKIRIAFRDGMSIRQLAQTFHHSRNTIRKILALPAPKPYTRTRPAPAPTLDPVRAIVDQILKDDLLAPPKQRHSAAQIFRRLQNEHNYNGSYDAVRRHVQQQRRQQRETFIPLAHEPGARLEIDFGHIHVDFPGGRQLVGVFLATWAYSNDCFALALPTQRTEAFLHGIVAAFEHFGCVPRELWFDNAPAVVANIFPGRVRQPTERLVALASHYACEPCFCLPARGNEKGHVENRVKVLQRQWATPVPCVADLAELNHLLLQRTRQQKDHTVSGQTQTVGERFAQDRAAAAELPPHRFDPCVLTPCAVDKFQTVPCDSNRYSVPRAWAFRDVTVKAYVDRVVVVAAGSEIACHARSYASGEQILDPLHYLASLGRKPAALDHAPVLRDWQLPEVFNRLRQMLETEQGERPGVRQYIRVLQLLAEHPLSRVQQAVERVVADGHPTFERIRARVARDAHTAACPEPTPDVTPLSQYQVPPPDLGRFDQLLSQGDDDACQ